MKLGIVLVLCVVLISIGLGIWRYGIRQQEVASTTLSNGHTMVMDEATYARGVAQESWGIGLLTCGGGFSIIAIVAMIIEHRKPKGEQ
jgi:hypothetical protein